MTKVKEYNAQRNSDQVAQAKANHLLRLYLPSWCFGPQGFAVKINWIQTVVEFRPIEHELRIAISALQTLLEARLNNDHASRVTSSKYYFQLLALMKKAVASATLRASPGLLLSCMLMALYEAFEGESRPNFGWQSHSDGVIAFAQILGPQAFYSSPMLELFRGFRRSAIVSGMVSRAPISLDSSSWRQEEWNTDVRSATTSLVAQSDQLDQILVDLPRYLCQADLHTADRALCEGIDSAQTATEIAARHLEAIYQRIQHWGTVLELSGISTSFKDHLLTKESTYPILHPLLLYHTSRLLCESALRRLRPHVGEQPDKPSPRSNAAADRSVDAIMAAIPIFGTQKSSFLEKNLMSWPLGAAIIHVKNKIAQASSLGGQAEQAEKARLEILSSALEQLSMTGLPCPRR